MAKILQLRRGTTTEHSTFTGASGELTVNTTLKLLVLHDGSTVGGFQIPKLVSGKVPFAQLDIQDATTGQKGIVELATQAEVNAGTDNTRAITPDTLNGGIRTNLNVIGSAPMYACRAWVNFDGRGVPSIRSSGNVSSITDNGIGDYTINFTNDLPDSNYAVSLSQANGGAATTLLAVKSDTAQGAATLKTSSQLRIVNRGSATTDLYDTAEIYVSVFR